MPPWSRGCSLSSCPAMSCAHLAANPQHSACVCDRSGGSARTRGAPERVFATSQPASQPASSSSSSSSSSNSSSDGAPSPRSARSACVHAHFCPLGARFRRLTRALLMLAGAGDAAERRRLIRHRLRPAAAALSTQVSLICAVALRPHASMCGARGCVAGGRAARRARSRVCYRACM